MLYSLIRLYQNRRVGIFMYRYAHCEMPILSRGFHGTTCTDFYVGYVGH